MQRMNSSQINEENILEMDDKFNGSNMAGTAEFDDNNLYVKGLWKECTQVELDDLFKQFGVITQSRVYGDGVGFVRFETPNAAKKAIETMNNQKPDSRSHEPLVVKRAYRKVRNNKRVIRVGKEDVEMIMNKNTNNVYLRCLPEDFTEKDLEDLCGSFGQLTCTRIRENGVAFVRFRQSEHAHRAIQMLNGKIIPGCQRPLLAKLANSDPFQPKIGFRPHNADDVNENETIRYTEDETAVAAALLAAKQHQPINREFQTTDTVGTMNGGIWNVMAHHNYENNNGNNQHRWKEHHYGHNEENNGVGMNNHLNHNRRRGRRDYQNNNMDNVNRTKTRPYVNEMNRSSNTNMPMRHGYVDQYNHNKHHTSNNVTTVGSNSSTRNVGISHHTGRNPEVFQQQQMYGVTDPASLYVYQENGGYPYYSYVNLGQNANSSTTGVTTNSNTGSLTVTTNNVTTASYYPEIGGTNYSYSSMIPNVNTQNSTSEMINGMYNTLPMNNGLVQQPVITKQSLTDCPEFDPSCGQLSSNPRFNSALGGFMEVPQDTLPMQTQNSESMTPQGNHMLKDRVHSGLQTTISNATVVAPVNKLNVPVSGSGSTLTIPQPSFSPGPASEYSSVISTGSTQCYNIAPSYSVNKVPSMAALNSSSNNSTANNTNSNQKTKAGLLSPTSRQVLNLQTQLTTNSELSTVDNSTKRFDSSMVPSIGIGLTTNGGGANTALCVDTPTDDMNWPNTSALSVLPTDNNNDNSSKNNGTNNNDVVGDRIFAAVYKHYPNNTKRITGQLLKDYDINECLKMLENASELKSKIDEVIKVI